MNALLHTCCAPCLLYPFEQLKEKQFGVTGFFYNPNVHGFAEYKLRAGAVESFALSAHCQVLYAEYNPEEFFRAVHTQEKPPARCCACWSLRLTKTAQVAKENGFELFSTTLLVSPYQDHEALKQIGTAVAAREGIAFYYQDFRPGFRPAHERARAQGIYCQKYCGCVYSEIERYSKK